MNIFEVGDTVELTIDEPFGNKYLKKGSVGTIIHQQMQSFISVDWGRDVGGHTCSGQCFYGWGWNVYSHVLKHYGKMDLYEDEVL